MTGISESPPRVMQELCLKNLRRHLFEPDDSTGHGHISSLLEVRFFQERTPQYFKEIEKETNPRKGTGIIVFNPEFRVNNAGWVAIYIGRDLESDIKGYLTLDDSGRIDRSRKEEAFHELAGLRYYLHTIERGDTE